MRYGSQDLYDKIVDAARAERDALPPKVRRLVDALNRREADEDARSKREEDERAARIARRHSPEPGRVYATVYRPDEWDFVVVRLIWPGQPGYQKFEPPGFVLVNNRGQLLFRCCKDESDFWKQHRHSCNYEGPLTRTLKRRIAQAEAESRVTPCGPTSRART